MTQPTPDVSVIIVSYNTRDLLRECLHSVQAGTSALNAEILVVDNASTDGSPAMITQEFPGVRLFESHVNLGFGAANNCAFEGALGRYFVLLNSDAFLAPEAIALAVQHMDANPNCGMGGGRLVGRDGSWQPSGRTFHSVLRDAIVLTGLAAKFPRSRFFGGLDRTWADEHTPAEVDWVPGAFGIIRPEALRKVGNFDPDFFLYYEEVDLCFRLKQAGYTICYWPDVVITHIGGESSRQLTSLAFSPQSSQVVLWRMRSTLLYYRKHHGWQAWLAKSMEKLLYRITILRNHFSAKDWRHQRERHYSRLLQLLDQAWTETKGGRTSPPRPW